MKKQHFMPQNYFSHYKSPNIVIEHRDVTSNPPPLKRNKIYSSSITQSPKYDDLSFLDDFNIDEIVSCLQRSDDMHQYADNNYNELKKISTTEGDGTIDNKSNIKLFQNRSIRQDNFAEFKKQNDKLTFSKFIEGNNKTDIMKNKNENVLGKFMDNNEAKVLTLKGDLNSKLSFEFIEHSPENIKETKCNFNNDLENCIRIKVNVDLVSGNNLTTKCITPKVNNSLINVRAENKEVDSTKNEVFSIKNMLGESYTETSNIIYNQTNNHSGFKQCVKNNLLSRDYYLVIEEYMLRYLNMQCSVQSIIRNGAHSKIFKCKNSTGDEYAIKILNAFQRKRHKMRVLKLETIKKMQSDIPKENFFCTFLHSIFMINRNWCLVMEFYPKNLRDVIANSSKPLNIHTVQDLARQLISAVMLLRNNNIVHTDIRPSHILLNCSNDKLKLCGFDQAYYIEDAFISPTMGTSAYRSPEIILGHSSGFSIDVWSTGLILHEMATGKKLFPGFSNKDILYKQMSTLGNIPPDMINSSRYRHNYFVGNDFKHTFSGCFKKKTIIISHFKKNDKIARTIYGAYYDHWAPSRTNDQNKDDMEKLNSFVNLLQKMIVLHPKRRLTIEFVYANPFVYNMSN